MWSSLPHRSLWKRPFHRSGCRPAAYTSLPWTPTLLPLSLSLCVCVCWFKVKCKGFCNCALWLNF
uniref:Uncharacterized protein n=1 Tax=Arundo donax TaxID=35708 RepID=A0A0A8XYG8_ARUDO